MSLKIFRRAKMSESMKVAFIGDSGVGKTSIIHAFSGIVEASKPTIGCQNFTFDFEVDLKKVQMFVFDTAGSDQYQDLLPLYCRNINCFIVVFNLTNELSFQHVNPWVDKALLYAPTDAKVVLVGNKLDLSDQIKINDDQITEKATEIGAIGSYTCSAVTNENINAIFSFVASNKTIVRTEEDAQHEGVTYTNQKQNCC